MTVPLEAPDPNPLQPYAVEIAHAMQKDVPADGMLARRNELSLYERLRFQTSLGPGLFNVCLRGIRNEIAGIGGPDEFLQAQAEDEREGGLPSPEDVLDLVFGAETPEEPIVISDSDKVFIKETLKLQAMIRRAKAYEVAESTGELRDPETGEIVEYTYIGTTPIPVYVVRGQAFHAGIFDKL